MIKNNNEIYYHFPLGGKLTKKAIYEKLSELLRRIKKDEKIKSEKENKKNKKEEDNKSKINLNYKNISIHLDLIYTEETSLIKEFLLSFLFTIFYINNGDIIKIPNNIKNLYRNT